MNRRNKGTLCAFLFLLLFSSSAVGQVRPDAFDPIEEPISKASIEMATTLAQMQQWGKYPTYEVYVEMMQYFALNYPQICRLDTIGTSVNGRLILSLCMTGNNQTEEPKPEFFYSSTIHGDELTGFYLMLRLCDTLLSSYMVDPSITRLLNTTVIYINPLSNPDGTYRGGNQTVAYSVRYNANNVDLNRNYPDPFGTAPLSGIQIENQKMMEYVAQHHFRMSANIHGGSEVMNYPWDSFTSDERLHPDNDWWHAVCRRFVDTCRLVDASIFQSVNSEGVIVGGDWYVIHNGRQDYMNFHSIREVTIEISNNKKLPSNKLESYWRASAHAWINLIKEVYQVPTSRVSIVECNNPQVSVYPNPTLGKVKIMTQDSIQELDFSDKPSGVYIISIDGEPVKIIKL